MGESKLIRKASGGRKIISKQTGILTLGATTQVTISEIDTTKAVAKVSHYFNSTSSADDSNVSIEIIDSTTIEIKRVGGSGSCFVAWEVYEINGVSIQSGKVSGTNNTFTATINAVDLDKSELIFSFNDGTTGGLEQAYCRGRFTSTTEIEFVIGTQTTRTFEIIYFVVEEK